MNLEFFLLPDSNLCIRKVSLIFLEHHIFFNLLLIKMLFPIQKWCFLQKRHLSEIGSTFCCQSTRRSECCWAELVNTMLIHMGILSEMYLFVLVSLSGHKFEGTVDVYNHEGCIIYTYIYI